MSVFILHRMVFIRTVVVLHRVVLVVEVVVVMVFWIVVLFTSLSQVMFCFGAPVSVVLLVNTCLTSAISCF